MSNREWVHPLQEQILERAKMSLREGDSYAYHALTDFAERLQKLSPAQQVVTHQLIKIFSANRHHQAELVPDFILEGKSRCIPLNGEFHTPSGIGSKLAGYQVNGWTWWRYKNERGEIRPIDDFRKTREI